MRTLAASHLAGFAAAAFGWALAVVSHTLLRETTDSWSLVRWEFALVAAIAATTIAAINGFRRFIDRGVVVISAVAGAAIAWESNALPGFLTDGVRTDPTDLYWYLVSLMGAVVALLTINLRAAKVTRPHRYLR